uniref:Uncharacterized protein n=1 Tax=Romanomermis culicivorax TaxID=13658 RepID=A0A915JJV3_ROMCU
MDHLDEPGVRRIQSNGFVLTGEQRKGLWELYVAGTFTLQNGDEKRRISKRVFLKKSKAQNSYSQKSESPKKRNMSESVVMKRQKDEKIDGRKNKAK